MSWYLRGNYLGSSELWSEIIVSANDKMQLKPVANILQATVQDFNWFDRVDCLVFLHMFKNCSYLQVIWLTSLIWFPYSLLLIPLDRSISYFRFFLYNLIGSLTWTHLSTFIGSLLLISSRVLIGSLIWNFSRIWINLIKSNIRKYWFCTILGIYLVDSVFSQVSVETKYRHSLKEIHYHLKFHCV